MAVKKTLLGLYALAVVVLIGALLVLARPSPPPATRVAAAAPPPAPDVPPPRRDSRDEMPPPPPADQPSVHAAIERKVEADRPTLHNAHDIDGYLADLEAHARQNGKVTALEVEPGLMAIREHAEQLGTEEALRKSDEFAQKMARLSAQLDGRPLNAPPPLAPRLPQQ
jgi:hypothetical protein